MKEIAPLLLLLLFLILGLWTKCIMADKVNMDPGLDFNRRITPAYFNYLIKKLREKESENNKNE